VRYVKSASDQDGRLYDSRHGLAGYYRYGPHKLKDLCNMRFSSKEDDEVTVREPKIPASVFERIIHGAHAYASIGLPEHYAVAARWLSYARTAIDGRAIIDRRMGYPHQAGGILKNSKSAFT